MNAIQTLDIKQLPVMIWKDMPVCTTEMLAQVYGTATDNIRVNFRSNRARFEEGKHYLTLEGEALREFRRCVSETYSPFVPGKFASKVNLWTGGAAP